MQISPSPPNRITQAIFGRYAASEKARVFARIGGLVVALDFVTKLIALATLREGQRVVVLDSGLLFQLTFNVTALGSQGREQGATRGLPAMLGAAVCLVGFSVVCLRFALAEQRIWRKVLLMAALVVVSSILAGPLGEALYPALGPGAMPAAKMLAVVALNLLLLRLARNRTLFVLLVIVASANLANAVNFIAFPRGAIDFIHIPLFGRWFGIANIADYIMSAAYVLLLAFVPIRIVVAVLISATANGHSRVLAWVDAPLARKKKKP